MLNIDAIRRALELEREKEELTQRRATLEAEKPPTPPEEPIDSSFTPKEYPPIRVKTDWKLAFGPVGIAFVLLFPSIFLGSFFNFVLLTLLPLTIIWAIAYFALFNKKRKETQRAKIETSPEYRSQCAQIDLENAQNEAQAYRDYCDAKKRYDEELLPQYEQEKTAWEAQHASKLAAIDERLQAVDAELETLYADEAAVDAELRNATDLETICRIADIDGSSDISQAVDTLKTERARRKALLAEQRRMREEEAEYERQVRTEERTSRRNTLLADTATTAVGTMVGTHGVRKEQRKQTKELKKQAEELKKSQNQQTIALLESQIADLRRQYHKADPVEGVHIQSQIRSIEHQIAKLRR